MTTNYTKRKIKLTFNLTEGTFPPPTGGVDDANSVTVSGLRTSVVITKGGEVGPPHAQIRVAGLSLSMMNKLTLLGKPVPAVNANTLTVAAGQDNFMPVVYVGNISSAWADFQAAPEVAMYFDCFTAEEDRMKPVPPTSYNGPVDVVTVMTDFASRMGYDLENSLTDVPILPYPYYPGTTLAQIDKCKLEANIEAQVDGRVLAIWPKNGHRKTTIPLISPDTGLIGYPVYASDGMIVTTSYNSAIVPGGRVKIQSEIKPACGTWPVYAVTHEIESETPGGAWRTTMRLHMWGHQADE